MIDLPENEVQGRMKSIRLVRFINVAKNQVNQTITENENKKSAKNVVSNRVNNTSNVEENQIKDIPNSDDLVNYKVGRLVMSILREFKVSNLLERFEKVLVQNAKISGLEMDEIQSPATESPTSLSNHKIRSSQQGNVGCYIDQ